VSLRKVFRIIGFVVTLLSNVVFFWNPFPWGQCTWFAAAERPDLVGSVWGNAGNWIWEASHAGFRTGSHPRVGSIAVWRPWQSGAWGYGHVAYVQRASSNGWFLVSEMDWPWQGRVTNRWVSPYSGVQFIYGRN
jgi:surface antigen